MNPLVVFLVAGGAAVAIARSARRTAGKLRGSGERSYDGYWLPDNVTIMFGAGVMEGPREGPAGAEADSTITILTELPLVGEDASGDGGLFGQVINPAAVANPDTQFLIWSYAPGSGMGEGVLAALEDPVPWPIQYEDERFYVDLMSKLPGLGYDVGSQEAIAGWMQHGITLIIQARTFNWDSNNVWITEDCSGVFVGERFWTTMAMEAPTLAETLAIPGNSALGYAAYLYSQGMEDPAAIATLIIQEIDPDCGKWGEYDSWPVQIHSFHDWLQQMIYEDVLGIPFPGGGA